MPIDPLVSVIMPAYNAADTIGAAISSVLTQTYRNVEIVVCSDGSTDDTEAIAAAYGERVTVVSRPNGGCAAARNAAMEVARGDLFALVDSDDILLPGYLEKAVATWRDAGGGEDALRAGDPAAAATEFETAARLLPSNKGLRRKALLLRAPVTGPVLAKVQARRHSQT